VATDPTFTHFGSKPFWANHNDMARQYEVESLKTASMAVISMITSEFYPFQLKAVLGNFFNPCGKRSNFYPFWLKADLGKSCSGCIAVP